ncbi:MAG TPA: DUF5691 domain-containing protein [Candidatus Obscuribacterales bacterium]
MSAPHRQNLWAPLLQLALPGTGQAPPQNPELPAELGQELELAADGPETRLLNLAAALALFQRAAELQRRSGEDTPAPAPPETRPPAPARLLGIWQRLLTFWPRARFRPDWRLIQREALAQTGLAGWRYPHRLLPELLEIGNDWGRDDPLLRLELLPLLGQRGLWLAGGPATAQTVRNPWNWVIDPEADSLPLARGPAACGLLLRRMRRTDPAAAREQLNALWPEADAGMRQALIPALETGLGPEDEAFLEACLDDRRREVRQQAQALLAHLAGSRFVARMQARMAPLLSLKPVKKGGEELDLRLPTWPTDPAEANAWQRDGLDKASFGSPGGRALVAEAMLKLCPPDFWLAHLGCSRSRLLELVRASAEFKQLGSGLAGATLQFRDPDMARALLAEPAFWQRNPAAKLLPLALVPVLPPAEQQAGYLATLNGTASQSDEIPAAAWYSVPAHTLEPAFIGAYLAAASQRLDRIKSDESPALLLPPCVILGAAVADLPRLLAFCRRWLEPWFVEHGDESENKDFEELQALLQTRHDLYLHLDAYPDHPPGNQHTDPHTDHLDPRELTP